MNSPVVSTEEMRGAEKSAFARGVSAETLMDEAGAGIARCVRHFFPNPGRCFVFVGKGNNAGDALVAARHLQECGWHIDTFLAFPEVEMGELARKKLGSAATWHRRSTDSSSAASHKIVLDGLLGIGSKPPLRDPVLSGCREINRLGREENAYVFAVDLPSGLDGDWGAPDPDCVIADFTVTIGTPKRGLVADEALNVVGRIEIVPLPELPFEDRDETVATASSLRG